jgi:pimeloyl-ACP methyl ester carboxylesterase
MQGTEIKAVGRLAGDALGGAGQIVGDVHRAVSSRVFGALGGIATPVRLAHDGITTVVQGSVRTGMRMVPAGSGHALAALAPPGAAPLESTIPGSIVLGAINGAWGDTIERRYAPLSLSLSLRGADPEAATGRLVVFVHGLGESGNAWGLGGGPTYGDRLRERHGYTPLYARYNTGRHISHNGRELACAIEEVVAGWPVEVTDITLIGHSMGGLVSRSAVHCAEKEGHAWVERTRHVFSLGSPHLGAPLERAANRGAYLLSRLPETAPLARLLTVRSAGIKDLRYGACLDEDWDGFDPDEYLRDRCNEFPFLASATYCFIGATVTADKDSRLAKIVGDLLVQFPSASGDGPTRKLAFEIDNGLHLGRMNHMQLLNHPKVYAQIEKWLLRAPLALTT